MEFCDYLKEIEAKCDSCWENGIGACHIKLGTQEYFGKDFGLTDTVQIIRHDHSITVETDIEVTYTTKFPYGRFAGKGIEYAVEYAKKDKAIQDHLATKIPTGVTLLRSHEHYSPDIHDPNRVAIHIHAHKTVEDLDEAKLVAHQLVQAIKPGEINKIIEKV